MTFFGQLLNRPKQLWLRRLNFQIHLWAGIVLALYVTVIGVTGSILVFGLELEPFSAPKSWGEIKFQGQSADIAVVIGKLAERYPHTHIVSLLAPTAEQPIFSAVLQTRRRITVACHPVTGAILGEIRRNRTWLDTVYDLHEDLLAGRPGRVVNGIGAASLLLLSLTGLVNWWPGMQNWRRALRVDFRRRWKRVNFDLHSATGFWTLLFILVWASSGIYFVWPAKVLALVDRVSPVVNSRPPAVSVSAANEIVRLDFHGMLERAYAADPGTTWKGIVFPASRRSPFAMLMSRASGIGRDYEDTLYFNPYDGKYISIWRYGVNKSVGDWFIWLQIPLHFGTHWGFAVKLVWAAAGLALPLLAITGLLMYWNRFLSKRWRSYSAKA